jgi:hypothetical protein
MDKDEFCKLMQSVMDVMPFKTNKDIMSLIIANMLMQYEIEDEWPTVIAQVTHILSEAMAEARAKAEAEDEFARSIDEDVATAAADAFLKNVLETHNQS